MAQPAGAGLLSGGEFTLSTGFVHHGAGVLPPPTCTADFDGDGDIGTDADIESFFRLLGGGAC